MSTMAINTEYDKKTEERADAIREFRILRKRLLSSNYSVEDINRALWLKNYYNL